MATPPVSVSCTNGTPYTVAFNVATGGGSFATRTMASGGNTLAFLFKLILFHETYSRALASG
ncbi:MAG: spore coat protein U domain-containing protein [Gammaproteobacteria bacterium]